MSLFVANSVEKNVVNVPTTPIVVPSNTPTDVLPDLTQVNGEYCGRFIQNVGANDCYYSFGVNCSPQQFNGVIAKPASVNANGHGSGQQFDSSNCGQRLSVYSVGGTTIAVTLLKRNNLVQGSGNIL